jgi:hypothetical protein
MARRLTDDEIMDYTYNKIFGDLDGIRSGSDFSDSKSAVEGVPDNAGTSGVEGINITVKPLMAGAAESGRPPEGGEPTPEDSEEEDDRIKGIGKMSPLMAQLHGDR